MKKQNIKNSKVTCFRCNHRWTYSKGIPTYRIRCPQCNSAQNNLNREIFGVWKP